MDIYWRIAKEVYDVYLLENIIFSYASFQLFDLYENKLKMKTLISYSNFLLLKTVELNFQLKYNRNKFFMKISKKNIEFFCLNI